jgi:hypothetical protein
VTCVTREGFGTALPITLHMPTLVPAGGRAAPACSGVDTVAVPFTFSYNAPTVQSIAPTHGPAAGGTPVVVLGTGFGGVDAPPQVALLVTLSPGVVVEVPARVTSHTHTSIAVVMPPAAGVLLDVVVTHSRTRATAVLAGAWSHDAPTVVDVAPVPQAGVEGGGTGAQRRRRAAADANYTLPCDGCTARWFPATSFVLAVTGTGFGPDPVLAGVGPGVQVAVGGQPCLPLPGATSVHVSDTRLECMAPATTVGDKAVAVRVAGQTAVVNPTLRLTALCDEGFQGEQGRVSCPGGRVRPPPPHTHTAPPSPPTLLSLCEAWQSPYPLSGPLPPTCVCVWACTFARPSTVQATFARRARRVRPGVPVVRCPWLPRLASG